MKILVATDGTSASEAAVEELLRLPLLRVAEINVLTVVPDKERWNEDSQLNADSFDATLPEDWGDRDERGEDPDLAFAEDLLNDVARLLRCKAGRVRRVVAVGHPAEEILHAAEKLDVDLIVMGNKGRTGIDRWVLGSVSEKVVQQAKCLVLIVKSPESHAAETVSES